MAERGETDYASNGAELSRLGVGLVAAVLVFALLCQPALARNAYLVSDASSNVTVIDTASNTVVGSPIPVGADPQNLAISPDGSRAYVANQSDGSVSVIDTATNTPVGSPVAVGAGPNGVAFTPDGSRAYVANQTSNSVSVIDTATNMTTGPPIPVANGPYDVAITPDGTRAYVTRSGSTTVSVIDTAANTVLGSPISVGTSPHEVALTPDGSHAYVANAGSNSVSVIDTATNAVAGPAISVQDTPRALAMTPDGARAYVANRTSGTVSVIDTATNTTMGSPITVGDRPQGVAITPDGSRAYVANQNTCDVSVIDTATNTVGSSIPVGCDNPHALAIVPDQGPAAAFEGTPQPASRAVDFNGGGSTDPDGTVARFDWDFGDGTILPDGGPTPTHAYLQDGTYAVTLTVTDNERCSTTRVFTGQTMSCNGGAAARTQQTVSVDGSAPSPKLLGKRRQPLDPAVEVNVLVGEASTATATGTLRIAPGSGRAGNRAAFKPRRYSLKAKTGQLAPGQKTTLKLRVPKPARKIGTKALRDGGKATARIAVSAVDAAGNSAGTTRRAKLIRRRG